jgi:hypothetical protein
MSMSDILSTLALALSVVSIFLQRTDARKQLIVANFSEYTSRYQELVKNFPSSIVRDDFILFDLPEDEQDKILRYMLLYFDLCYEEYFLYKTGLIEPRIWEVWKEGIKSTTSRPAFRQSWNYISNRRSIQQDTGFRNMMDAMTNS